MTSPPDHTARTGTLAAALSNLVVRITTEYTGRGPTRARTHISENLISVVLEDTLSKGERSLVRDGYGDRVRSMREAFQRTMGAEMVAGVEELTGRRVIAFMSSNHIDPDMAIEAFVLESPNGAI
jgi:uncharacterized protein YbcI